MSRKICCENRDGKRNFPLQYLLFSFSFSCCLIPTHIHTHRPRSEFSAYEREVVRVFIECFGFFRNSYQPFNFTLPFGCHNNVNKISVRCLSCWSIRIVIIYRHFWNVFKLKLFFFLLYRYKFELYPLFVDFFYLLKKNIFTLKKIVCIRCF